MHFPAWVTNPRLKKQEKASNRLKYLLARLALDYSKEGSITHVASCIGMSHTTFYNYIARGAFSDSMALRIEKLFGRENCPNEWLRDPLSIPVTATVKK